MTTTRTSIEIAASPHTIYRLASATDRWPQILPHYRYVKTLSREGNARIVEMAARRGAIPLRWVAEQIDDPVRPHIAFRHLRGWTRGMDVEWIFEPRGDTTLVTIEHRLEFKFPIAAEWLARHVVSDYFIDGVAHQTLACMKRLAEACD